MSEDSAKIPLITLVGDPEENFYQLGLRDKIAHGKLLIHLQSLARTPWKKMDSMLADVLQRGVGLALPPSRTLTAYAEGLDRDPREVAFWLLLPELMSGLPKWLPGLKAGLWGCSSFFAWNHEINQPLHGRILDFPLVGSYDREERAICYQLDGEPKIFSLSSAGFPYPALTAMSDQGVTLAIHQKFSKKMFLKGTPIFELIHRLLREVHDKKSALEFLRRSRSLTTWGINLGFKNGEVLSADLAGEEQIIREFQLDAGKIFYFNNRTWDEDQSAATHVPHGLRQYCEMRERIATKKIEQLMTLDNIDESNLTKSMATPLEQKMKGARYWKMDVVTPASLTIASMNSVSGSCTYVAGPAPKYLGKSTIHFSEIWQRPVQTVQLKARAATNEEFAKGMQHYIQAQTCLDHKDRHGAFHNLQMSISHLQKRPEESVARFFLLVLRFMDERGRVSREHTLQGFEELKGNLPPYLNDQALLFISRLEHILGLEQSIPLNQVGSTFLRDMLRLELNIPPRFLHAVVAPLMSPRMEILDIIYGHLK